MLSYNEALALLTFGGVSTLSTFIFSQGDPETGGDMIISGSRGSSRIMK